VRSTIRRWLRRAAGLDPARSGSEPEIEWVPMDDGVRLHTLHIWPIDVRGSAPTVVMRTPHDLSSGPASPLVLGQLIAESGYHVVLQDVRGRHASEGRYTPFESERADGGRLLDWVSEQSWCDGRIGLFGKGYAGYCAWAAVAEAPDLVDAMALINCTRDPYRVLHPGGALALELALGWAVAVGDREAPPAEHVDLKRGLEFRPVREADRVASRVVDWYRDWIDHPSRDEYWRALCPPLPYEAPPTLLISRWHDPYLDSIRADHAALRALGEDSTRLVIGEWPADRDGLPLLRRGGLMRSVLRESIAHFDLHLRGEGAASAAPRVRYFDRGEGAWCPSDHWPPADTGDRKLHLRATNGSGSGLSWEPPPSEEPADRCGFDPANPVRWSDSHEPDIASGDVLVYESEALGSQLRLAGEVSLVLYVSSDAEDTDVSARLFALGEGSEAMLLCSGVARARWRGGDGEGGSEPCFMEPGEVIELRVALGPCAALTDAGRRLRLEIACSDLPRMDRSSGSRTEPALARPEDARASEQTIRHDGRHPSHVVLPVAQAAPSTR